MYKLDVEKSTSSEDFQTWISVEGEEDVCLPLNNILNLMQSTSEIPVKCKRAQIRPIHRVACPTKHKDYQPVSIFFHLGTSLPGILSWVGDRAS